MKRTSISNQNSIPEENVTKVTRRNFISSCSACAACMALAPLSYVSASAAVVNGDKKMRVRIIYSIHSPVQTKPDWPNIGFDFNPFMEKINAALTKNLSEFEFIPTLATGPEVA
jgi:hypothetical protein